jgi:hypothetical protein
MGWCGRLLMILFCASFELSLFNQQQVFLEPRIVWIDRSELIGAESIKSTFTLHNRGNQKVNILSVKPDCSCTGYHVTAKEIKPNTRITLALDFQGESLLTMSELYAVIETDGNPRYLKASIKVKK